MCFDSMITYYYDKKQDKRIKEAGFVVAKRNAATFSPDP